MLWADLIMCALDAGVALPEIQDRRKTTTVYDHRRQNFDQHAAYVVVAFLAERLSLWRLAGQTPGLPVSDNSPHEAMPTAITGRAFTVVTALGLAGPRRRVTASRTDTR